MNTCGDRTLRRGCLRAVGGGDAVWAHLCSKPSSAGRGDAQNAGCGVSFLRGFRVSAGADSRSALPWVSRGSGGQELCRTQSHQPLCPRCRLMFPQVPNGINQRRGAHVLRKFRFFCVQQCPLF